MSAFLRNHLCSDKKISLSFKILDFIRDNQFQHEEKCEKFEEQDCHTEYREECAYEENEHCETSYKQECTEEKKQECKMEYKTVYEKVKLSKE